MPAVRALGPAVAGRWYPRERDALGELVDALLAPASVDPAPRSRVAWIVAPHAGFAYSGSVAAEGFAAMRSQELDRVFLLGPSHHFGFRGAAIPGSADVYRTPLGDVPIDGAIVSALGRSAIFRSDDAAFAPEHALEAELPFLQRIAGNDVPIVPILFGGAATSSDTTRVADALAPHRTPKSSVVVSSDFTHFGARFGYTPFAENVEERVRALDSGAIDAIVSGDADAFARYVDATRATICGKRAIEVLLRLFGSEASAALLSYDTSGRMTGDFDHSVSYAAITGTTR